MGSNWSKRPNGKAYQPGPEMPFLLALRMGIECINRTLAEMQSEGVLNWRGRMTVEQKNTRAYYDRLLAAKVVLTQHRECLKLEQVKPEAVGHG